MDVTIQALGGLVPIHQLSDVVPEAEFIQHLSLPSGKENRGSLGPGPRRPRQESQSPDMLPSREVLASAPLSLEMQTLPPIPLGVNLKT